LSGIVTVGTPHQGAPILNNFADYASFGLSLMDAIWAVFNEFNFSCCEWRWILTEIVQHLINAAGLFDISLGQVFLKLGLHLGHPVIPEMFFGSGFLNDINSAGNVVRENAEIGSRVGIISVADNFYPGGPMRAAFPDHADGWVYLRELARGALDFYAGAFLATAPFEDWHAFNLANRMSTASWYLGSMDDWWCRAVSWPGFGMCWENDTIVPVWTQDYSTFGGVSGVIYGPTHTQETQQSDGALSWALTTFMSVNGRTVPPPPPPPPPSGNNTLWAETGLSDGRYRLEYGFDGNLVLYDEHGAPLWWSGTWSAPGVAWMRADGGFVIYNGSEEAVWHSGTHGDLGNWYLRVENNGTFVIYMPDGTPVWSNF
jgi:hypothetical protein